MAEEKGTAEDEMVGWHHRFSRHEFEQALGDSEGQGHLVCCSPWGCKELDTTERLNNSNNLYFLYLTAQTQRLQCIVNRVRTYNRRIYQNRLASHTVVI